MKIKYTERKQARCTHLDGTKIVMTEYKERRQARCTHFDETKTVMTEHQERKQARCTHFDENNCHDRVKLLKRKKTGYVYSF